MGQQVQMCQAFGCELPFLSFFEYPLSAGCLAVNLGIDIEQFYRLVVTECLLPARGAANRNAIGIQRDYVPGEVVWRGRRIDQVWVALGPLEGF